MNEPNNKLKKIITIISVNIIIIVIILFILNWVCYRYLYPLLENTQFDTKEHKITFGRKVITPDDINEIYPIRKFVGTDQNYNKKSIIMFGCSYGYGHMLEDEQTFHYKISNLLKRPVYNYSSSGESTQFALMKIQNHKIDDVIRNSEYAILVTIGEHVWRVHTHSNGYSTEFTWPRYDIRNGELVFHKYKFPMIEASYLYKYIQKLFFARILTESSNKYIQDYMFDYMKLHYETIKKELEKINPNIKIIIIVYKDSNETDSFTFNPRWKELEDEGFIVVNVHSYLPFLRDIDYIISETDGHPNEKAWDSIIKLLVDDLKVLN